MAQTIQFNIETNTGQSNQSIAALKQEFEQLNQFLENAEQGTEEFSQALRRAGEVKGSIDALNESIDALRPQKQFETIAKATAGMVGGFQSVAAAVQLFGVENEALLESLQRVNALMAVTQGLQAFGESITSVRALQTQIKTLIPSLMGATKGVTAFGTALKLTGIGLVVSAVAYLVTNFDELKGVVEDLFPELGDLSNVMGQIVDVAKAVGSALLEFVATPIKTIINLIKGDFEGAKNAIINGFNVIGNASQSFNESQEQRAEEHKAKMTQIEIDRLEDSKRILEAEGKSTTEIQRRIYKLKEQLAKGNAEELRKIQTDSSVFEAGLRKNQQDEDKRNADERNRLANEAATKRKEREQQLNDKLKEFSRERELLQMDELERSLAMIDDKYKTDLELLRQNGKDVTDLEFIIESEKQKIRDEFKQKEIDAQKRLIDERLRLEKEYNDNLIKEGNIQLQKLNTQYETRYYSLQRALENGEISEKEFRNKTLEISLQALNDEIALNQQRLMNGQITFDEFIKLQNDLVESRRNVTNTQVELNKAIEISEEEKYDVISGALSSVSSLIGENTVAGKALAIAAATIDTYKAGTLALSSYPPPFGAIALAGTIAQGLATVKKIIGVKVPGNKGTAASTSAPAPAIVQPPRFARTQANVTQTILSPTDRGLLGTPVKAIVTEVDITRVQNRVREIQRSSSF